VRGPSEEVNNDAAGVPFAGSATGDYRHRLSGVDADDDVSVHRPEAQVTAAVALLDNDALLTGASLSI
jgi:hypothetical protein